MVVLRVRILSAMSSKMSTKLSRLRLGITTDGSLRESDDSTKYSIRNLPESQCLYTI